MSEFTYPAELAVPPLTKAPTATVTVPGSKSITNRALALAALASRESSCALTGALRSEDTEVMVECLRKLGFRVDADWARAAITLQKHGSNRLVPAEAADLFVANSGTTVRFLAAMVSLSPGRYRLDGVPRMRERPIRDLLDALVQVPGVTAASETGTGCPPVVIGGTGWPEKDTVALNVRADTSSQFLSGLAIAAAFHSGEAQIRVTGETVSEPYVRMTDEMIRAWCGTITLLCGSEAPHQFEIRGSARHKSPARYAIEPDASSASYFWAAAAVAGGRVTVSGLNRTSLQGDVRFVDVLAQMGCRVEECDTGITVRGGKLRGVDVDMNDISDTVMTLGAVALFADGPTAIRNVAHIRHKETDRIAALATELRKLGAEVEEREDGLTITPRPPTGCAVDTYNDHRMAMSLALVGLRAPGVVIRNPGCVAKTYPGFWQDLAALRQ
ncbi:MAG: 3-phosphoshikimate 1-carboxyvinyltransferase [Gemmata sp.]